MQVNWQHSLGEAVGPFKGISSISWQIHWPPTALFGSDNGPIQVYRQHCLRETVGPFKGIGSISW